LRRKEIAISAAGKRKILAAGLFLIAIGLAGCATNQHPVNYYMEPPPPLADPQTDQPSPDQVWINGRWVSRGAGFIWERGHWEKPPHPGLAWVPDEWTKQPDRLENTGRTDSNGREIVKLIPGKSVCAPGRWEKPPHPGAVYVPDQWIQQPDGTTLHVPGHWQ